MVYVILIGYWGILSIWDIKRKELPVRWLGVGIVAAQGYGVWHNLGIGLLLGTVPGLLLLMMSFLTKEKVGYGDGIMVMILGLVLGWPEVFWVYMIAQFGVFMAAIYMLSVKKASKEMKIPFAPFLTVGLLMYKLGGMVL